MDVLKNEVLSFFNSVEYRIDFDPSFVFLIILPLHTMISNKINEFRIEIHNKIFGMKIMSFYMK